MVAIVVSTDSPAHMAWIAVRVVFSRPETVSYSAGSVIIPEALARFVLRSLVTEG